MRKTLVYAILAAFCAAFAVASVEGGGMTIAAHHAMLAGGGWKNPYVTDGLVAMWDGEWNVGGGVISATAASE